MQVPKFLSTRAPLYVWGILVLGIIFAALALRAPLPSQLNWLTLIVFAGLAVVAQRVRADSSPNDFEANRPAIIFFFAGILLLPISLFVLLVIITHLIEWGIDRVSATRARDWYMQPLNAAIHLCAGSVAGALYFALNREPGQLAALPAVLGAMVAAIAYVGLTQTLFALALVQSRGVPPRESGILDLENLLIDFVMLCLGFVVAVLWNLSAWLILPIVLQLVVIYRALRTPQLKRLAQTDEKTGLWNARHFNTLFTAEVNRAARHNHPLAVIMADLDLLRNINNTYGHLAGDRVLAGIGKIIRETLREYDIAARFGGEEFAILLPETAALEAQAIAERLRHAVESASFEAPTSPTPIHATMSLGLSFYPQDGATSVELLHQADVAVYQAKLSGRNRVITASDVSAAELPRLLPEAYSNRIVSPAALSSRFELARVPAVIRQMIRSFYASAAAIHLSRWSRSIALSPTIAILLLLGALLIGGEAIAFFAQHETPAASPNSVLESKSPGSIDATGSAASSIPLGIGVAGVLKPSPRATVSATTGVAQPNSQAPVGGSASASTTTSSQFSAGSFQVAPKAPLTQDTQAATNVQVTRNPQSVTNDQATTNGQARNDSLEAVPTPVALEIIQPKNVSLSAASPVEVHDQVYQGVLSSLLPVALTPAPTQGTQPSTQLHPTTSPTRPPTPPIGRPVSGKTATPRPKLPKHSSAPQPTLAKHLPVVKNPAPSPTLSNHQQYPTAHGTSEPLSLLHQPVENHSTNLSPTKSAHLDLPRHREAKAPNH